MDRQYIADKLRRMVLTGDIKQDREALDAFANELASTGLDDHCIRVPVQPTPQMIEEAWSRCDVDEATLRKLLRLAKKMPYPSQEQLLAANDETPTDKTSGPDLDHAKWLQDYQKEEEGA